MSNTTNLLHGCDTVCYPLLPSNLLRTELNSLKLNICSSENITNQGMIDPTPDSRSSEHSMYERPDSGALSNDPSSYQTSSREDAEVTMCICPVCGFSASSPRGQDEHMETEHGDCYTADVPSTRLRPSHHMERTSPVLGRPSPDVFSSSTYGLRASSTPQQTRSVHDPAELGASLTGSTTGFNLPHTTSLPHFPYEFPISQQKVNGIPAPDTTNVATSVTTGFSPTREITRTGAKMRTYRGSLCRNLRVGSASKLTENESNMESSLLLQKVDSRRRYRCNICPATFPWHGDLTEHLRLAHGMQKTRESARNGKAGSFCCNHCKYVAKYQSELRRHMRLHWGVKPFVCVFCPYRSAWKGDLKRHMESHHRERFSSEAELIEVMSQFKNNAGTTVNGLPLTTKSVGDAYIFGSDFESEIADDVSCKLTESHELSSGEVSLNSFPKPSSQVELVGVKSSVEKTDKADAQLENSLICTICSYKAQNQSKLHNHMAGHMNLKPFKCPICEHRSNYKWDVRKHLRSQHPEQANLPVVVLSGNHTTTETATPLNSSPLDSPLSLRIEVSSKSPEHTVTTPNPVHLPSTSLTSQSTRWPIQQIGLCEPTADVVPIDLSVGVKDAVTTAPHSSIFTTFSNASCLSASSEPVVSETLVHHTISSLVDRSLSTNPCSSPIGLSGTVPKTTTNVGPLLSFPPANTLPWTPGVGMDQAGVTQSGNPSTIGLLFNLQQQLLMNGLLHSWSGRPFPSAVSSPSNLPLQLPTTNQESENMSFAATSLIHANKTEPNVPDRLSMSEFHRTIDKSGLHGKAPSEWSSTDTDLSDLSQAVRSTISIDSLRHRDPQRRPRGRKSGPACYGRSVGSLGSKEEQWKRHQCSGCGHRSNWKWDINKHIKVAHPERTNITTVTLDLEEAKNTFGEYMNRLKLSRTRYLHDGAGGSIGGSSAPGAAWASNLSAVSEGYYRPYKCSVCGHRSNWKWDVRKHIKQMHNSEAEVITLSLDEARRTIHQYKSCRRQQTRHLEPDIKTETSYINLTGPPSQSTNRKENASLSPNSVHWSAIEEGKSDEMNPKLTQTEAENHTANRLQTLNSPNVPKERSFKLYYSCRQCGRRFRSYQTLFFHLHHRHHIASSENKSVVTPRISIGFYYNVSRCYTRSAGSSNFHQTKVFRNSYSIPSYLRDQLSEKPLYVSKTPNIVPKSEDVRSEIDTFVESNNDSNDLISDRRHFVGHNVLQRDRLLRGRRRTCVPVTHSTKALNFLTQESSSRKPFTRPLSSHENATSSHRSMLEDSKTPCDVPSRTVKQLSDLLDKVLFILEEEVSGPNGLLNIKQSLNEQANCSITSHLADMIEETVSKNENIHYTASHLDTSSSSNEENRPLIGTKQETPARPLNKLLNHPEVEQRFLRLAALLHIHGNGGTRNSDTPCKRPRLSEHAFHEHI